MVKKRMQVVVDEVITGPCPDCKIHAGVMARQEAICAKMEERDDRLGERIDDREKMALLRFETLKESIDVAKQTMDARLQGMNQLTHQLDMQRQETKEKLVELTATFLPKERFDSDHKTFSVTINAKMDAISTGLSSKIEALQNLMATKREGMRWIEYIFTVIISFVVFVLARLVFKF